MFRFKSILKLLGLFRNQSQFWIQKFKAFWKRGLFARCPKQRMLLQSFIFSPQKRRGHAPSDRPQLPQSIHRQHALSNGAPISHKISFENRSLHDQTRLERCLPFGTDSPGLPKISTVHLERQNLPVPSAPLRVEHSPPSVHAVAKTSGSLSTETWSSPCDLSRRHSHYRILRGRDTPAHRNDYVSPRMNKTIDTPKIFYSTFRLGCSHHEE